MHLYDLTVCDRFYDELYLTYNHEFIYTFLSRFYPEHKMFMI